jgi:type IV secretory pathway ATPase VirB11/archaellum biosynthesis ATPase
VLTVEDPIEYRLSGVTQIQVNHAVDLGFAQVLRAMLRQDPGAVMVGEVRDDITAPLALDAAMTGHLMLTSVHANNAIGVIQRFEHRPATPAASRLSRCSRSMTRCAPRSWPPRRSPRSSGSRPMRGSCTRSAARRCT